jgi:SAM-dependent methyltransferase
MKFKESPLAHRLLDGLQGLEIGGSAHNPFGLKTRNVDYTAELTSFKQEEIKLCGEALPVDIVSPGDQLPLDDNSVDFVLSSHVIEHFADPIKALKEWYRVVKPGGHLYIVAPHKERTFDIDRPRTTLAELIERHETGKQPDRYRDHCSVWITEDFVELIRWLGWTILEVQDVDDKVGNGFTVVVQVKKDDGRKPRLEAGLSKAPSLPPQPLWAHPQRIAPERIAAAPVAD